ncbi:RNA ligase family protein [Neobacillus massiliamazoniensis]|uniref:SPBc2 prophage-derived DNA ligase-like protein ligB n=1 Tax=Neobacillus massiliamazoniensis TaxID=1499688 RepID=A0A0U1P3G5_9BACI|nr:RNA ligase family protein [Neobacillus massiliamazoniensis]CRK84688.1 SPBc2 prophage-derived DNA ligase-like protein ligB [Neobacillus massiliamazoniensis]
MFVSPMLLHKSDHSFDDDSYITELKLDGFRTIWTKFDNKVKIYTRHNTEITSMFPELTRFPFPNGTVLDGEIIVADLQGRPDFEAVMERFKSKKSEHRISFCVFDIIYFNGNKITNLPLLERKEILAKVITEDTPLLNKVQWIEGNGVQYFELIKQHDLEGTVQKKSNSKYQINKRSHDWLKVINYKYDNVYIFGLRKNEFGLLLTFEDGKYAGLMEFVTPHARKEFYQQYKEFIIEDDEKFIYLDPKMKIKVKYRNLTKNGQLRIPSFVEWL